MAVILCIETSSTNCSVALASDVIAAYKNNFSVSNCWDLIEDNSDQYSHGERLHVYIDQLLQRNDLKASDLDAIAVSAGPGSYTGLRIGVATAKGLSYTLDIPLIAISTLESLAVQAVPAGNNLVIPMLDARRMEVYAAVYEHDNLIEIPQAVVLNENSYANLRDRNDITFIGTGIEKFKNIIIDQDKHRFISVLPTALTMCDLAIHKYKKSDTVDVAYFEPYYLKEFKTG